MCNSLIDKSHREALSQRRTKSNLTALAKQVECAEEGREESQEAGRPIHFQRRGKAGLGRGAGTGVQKALPLRWTPCAAHMSRVTTSVRLTEDSDTAIWNHKHTAAS